MIQDTLLVSEVGRVLQAYINIHNDVYGGSFWRAVRRMVPIPGLFQRIDFADHATILVTLAARLDELTVRARDDLLKGISNQPREHFLERFIDYTRALSATIGHLLTLCDALAEKGSGVMALPREEYDRMLEEYDRARNNYILLGAHLNHAVAALKA